MVCIESIKYQAKRAADACASFDLTPEVSSIASFDPTPTTFSNLIDMNRLNWSEHVQRAAKQGFKALTYAGFLDISIYIWNTP